MEGGRAPAVGSPVLPPCSVHPPLPLGSFCSVSKSSCLTADSDCRAKCRPAAGQHRSQAPGAPGRPEMLHGFSFPSPSAPARDVLRHGWEPSPAPSACSTQPGAMGSPQHQPLGRGPGRGSFAPVATRYQPLVIPAPSLCHPPAPHGQSWLPVPPPRCPPTGAAPRAQRL